VITTSCSSLPAPTVSPLSDDYLSQVERASTVLNSIEPSSIAVFPFDNMADGLDRLVQLAKGIEIAEVR
jgi:hypothetical protein